MFLGSLYCMLLLSLNVQSAFVFYSFHLTFFMRVT